MHIIGIHEEISYWSQGNLISQKQYTVTQTLEPLSVNCPNEAHRKTTEKKPKQTTQTEKRKIRSKFPPTHQHLYQFYWVSKYRKRWQKREKKKRTTETKQTSSCETTKLNTTDLCRQTSVTALKKKKTNEDDSLSRPLKRNTRNTKPMLTTSHATASFNLLLMSQHKTHLMSSHQLARQRVFAKYVPTRGNRAANFWE
jgi:hypothetical protein